MSQTRFKRANIFFFVLLILLIAYLFNKTKVEQQLIDWGLKLKPDTVAVVLPDTNIVPLNNNALQTTDTMPKENNSGLALWRILTQGQSDFYVGGNNRFMIQAAEIAPKQITPVVNGNKVSIETLDAERGLYRLNATATGKAEISLFYVNDRGTTDLLGSREFTILSKAPVLTQMPDTGYLWSLVTQLPDTLLYGANNPFIIAVAETAPENIEATISGQGNELQLTDTVNSTYNAVIRTTGAVTITVRINTGKQNRLLGSRQFVVKNTGATGQVTQQLPENGEEPVIFAQHNLLLYAGVPNTIYPKLPQTPGLQPIAQTNNGSITLNNGNFIVTPAREGALQLTITTNSGAVLLNQQFEVVQSPNPAVAIRGNTGGEISVNILRNSARLELVKAKGFTKPDFTILAFDAVFYSAGRSMVKVNNPDAAFNTDITQQLLRMNPADLLYLTNIQVSGSDGSRRTLAATTYIAK